LRTQYITGCSFSSFLHKSTFFISDWFKHLLVYLDTLRDSNILSYTVTRNYEVCGRQSLFRILMYHHSICSKGNEKISHSNTVPSFLIWDFLNVVQK
jgi:hypothetical protein